MDPLNKKSYIEKKILGYYSFIGYNLIKIDCVLSNICNIPMKYCPIIRVHTFYQYCTDSGNAYYVISLTIFLQSYGNLTDILKHKFLNLFNFSNKYDLRSK